MCIFSSLNSHVKRKRVLIFGTKTKKTKRESHNKVHYYLAGHRCTRDGQNASVCNAVASARPGRCAVALLFTRSLRRVSETGRKQRTRTSVTDRPTSGVIYTPVGGRRDGLEQWK